MLYVAISAIHVTYLYCYVLETTGNEWYPVGDK